MKLKALIFDFDGTLVNTFELIVAAYHHVASTHGLEPPTAEVIRGQMGRPLPDIIEFLFPGQNVSELLHTNNEYVMANALSAEAFEGLKEMLINFQQNKFKLAVLTSGGAKVIKLLQHHGIDDFFGSVVHHERIANHKPHPEGYLLACKELGVDPNETIMIGDSVQDIEAGKNAQALATVALTHGFAEVKDLENAKPDIILDSLPELENYILQNYV